METLLSFDISLTLFINGSDSVWLDGVAWLATRLYPWFPYLLTIVAILGVRLDRRQFLLILLGAAVCVALSDQVASSIIKPWVCRLRPTHDPALTGFIDIVNGYRGGKYGFFSSHAANTMSVAVYLSLFFRQRCITLSLVLWSLLTCWTRVYLGVHFFGDVLIGALYGACVGYVAYAVVSHFTRCTPQLFKTTDGYYVMCNFVCILLAISILACFVF